MRSRILLLSVALIALIACTKKSGETGTPASVTADKSGPVEITDDEITRYLTWTREWGDLAKQHTAEAQAVADRVAAKYSFGETGKISHDPELLAVLDRQRAAMQEHMNRLPLNDAQLNAFKAVFAALVPRRDDQALARVREKYGDAFVDRLLARENEITAGWRP